MMKGGDGLLLALLLLNVWSWAVGRRGQHAYVGGEMVVRGGGGGGMDLGVSPGILFKHDQLISDAIFIAPGSHFKWG